MNTVQPNLHKYFKVKKNFKENSKVNKFSRESQKSLSDDLTEARNSDAGSSNSSPSTSPVCRLKVNPTQRLIHHGEDQSTLTTECYLKLGADEEPSLIEDVGKNQSVEENSINESTQDAAAKTENEVSHLSVTPKKKAEIADGPSRKRKRQQLDEDGSSQASQTPPDEGKRLTSASVMVPLEDKSGVEQKTLSAKKRLIMEGVQFPQHVQEKLDPETIKKRLGKCARLDELRSRLLKLNQCEEKLEAFRNQTLRNTEEAKTLSPQKPAVSFPRRRDLRVSSSPYKISSPRKGGIRCVPSPRKLDELRLNRFNSLDIEVPDSPKKSPARITTPVKARLDSSSHSSEPSSGELYFPHRYQFVKEAFRAVDTVVSLLHNRQEVITFSKLKPAVQEMLRKTFSQTHLGQLKTVFPFAYFFAQEKLKSKNASTYNALNYELTVKPNLDYKKAVSVTRNLMQDMKNADMNCSKFRKMDSVVLVERRHIFHSALLDILKKHHEKFLHNLDPPINLEGPLRRWHPEFPIEDVPPPSSSSLPQLPSTNTIDTAKDVLDKAREIFSVNNRMKEAVAAAASVDSAGPAKVPSTTQPQITDKSQVVTALRGVSLSLLEKIRAREAVKAAREMTRGVVASKELAMLSRLPELVRVLRSVFVAEKKAALPWDAVVAKVVSSHSGSLSASETENHLNLLMKQVPEWCTRHNVRSGLYLKIDKSRQLHEIIDKLNTIIKEKT